MATQDVLAGAFKRYGPAVESAVAAAIELQQRMILAREDAGALGKARFPQWTGIPSADRALAQAHGLAAIAGKHGVDLEEVLSLAVALGKFLLAVVV